MASRVRSGIVRSAAVAVACVLTASGCAGSSTGDADPPEQSAAPEASPPSTTTVSPPSSEVPTTTSAEAGGQTEIDLPDGALYAPSSLPEGWSVVAFRQFDSVLDADGPWTVFVVHRVTGGFDGGGFALEVAEFGGAEQAAAAASLGSSETRPIDGMTDVEFEEDQSAGIRTLSGVLSDRYAVRLFGGLPEADLVDVAQGLTVVDGEPSLSPSLADWAIESLGARSDGYLLDFQGPSGFVSIIVTPDRTQASLYISGSDLEEALAGEKGVGYYAVQRIEAENLEFPSIRWWVPDVDLQAIPSAETEVIVEILDAFVEVAPEEFREFVQDAAIEIIALEVVDDGAGPDGDDEAEPGAQSLDDELEDRLVAFIEEYTGRSFDEVPEISVVEAASFRGSIPVGTFVPESLWEVMAGLGLVAPGDDRLAADAVRREQVRGICCPVAVVDTGDPPFNEVVLVHELTHGLDAELNRQGPRSVEPVDPARALVEGNAHRVAFAYAEVLRGRGAAIPEPPHLFPADGDPRLPSAIQQILEFPYDEGRIFSLELAEARGEDGITDAFARPPATSEQILDIDAYLNGEVAEHVDPPTIPSTATVRQRGSLGAFVIKLLVEESVGPETALDLATAWAGDGFVLYDDGDQRCISGLIRFDTPEVSRDFADAAVTIDITMVDEAEVGYVGCAAPVG